MFKAIVESLPPQGTFMVDLLSIGDPGKGLNWHMPQKK